MVYIRFEDMSRKQVEALLKELHRTVNQRLFGGELQDIRISYCIWLNPSNKKRSDGRTAIACYDHNHSATGHNGRVTNFGACITFDFIDFRKAIKGMPTEYEQAKYITEVMIHEMCHQYCHEKGIDQGNHNETWQRIAEEHGIHSLYKDGKQVEEWLLPGGGTAIAMRLRIE